MTGRRCARSGRASGFRRGTRCALRSMRPPRCSSRALRTLRTAHCSSWRWARRASSRGCTRQCPHVHAKCRVASATAHVPPASWRCLPELLAARRTRGEPPSRPAAQGPTRRLRRGRDAPAKVAEAAAPGTQAVRNEKLYTFLANDFSEPRWRSAALKNAFALLSKQQHELAAARSGSETARGGLFWRPSTAVSRGGIGGIGCAYSFRRRPRLPRSATRRRAARLRAP